MTDHDRYSQELKCARLGRDRTSFRAFPRFLALSSSSAVRTAEETSLLSSLPPVLQSQAIAYAEQTELPAELVIELAIAHFLDPDSVTFDDCQVKVEQTSIAWLKQYADELAAA